MIYIVDTGDEGDHETITICLKLQKELQPTSASAIMSGILNKHLHQPESHQSSLNNMSRSVKRPSNDWALSAKNETLTISNLITETLALCTPLESQGRRHPKGRYQKRGQVFMTFAIRRQTPSPTIGTFSG